MATGRRDGAESSRRVRADTVLPIVRAALARGEGPPAVLAWVRRQGALVARGADWTTADEARARTLAARLAASLDRRGRAALETKQEWAVTDTQGECPGHP
jgi:hypothetical protein